MRKNLIAITLAVIAAVMVAASVYRSEADTVFKKASRICLECVGIG